MNAILIGLGGFAAVVITGFVMRGAFSGPPENFPGKAELTSWLNVYRQGKGRGFLALETTENAVLVKDRDEVLVSFVFESREHGVTMIHVRSAIPGHEVNQVFEANLFGLMTIDRTLAVIYREIGDAIDCHVGAQLRLGSGGAVSA